MRALTFAAAFALLAPGLAMQRIASGSIAGEIRTLDGAAAAGIRVSALAVPGSNVSATDASVTLSSLAQTDGSGRFRLQDLPAGRYYVTAGLLDFPTYYPGAKTQADARIVTIGAGAAASGIDFVLARPAGVRVSGRMNGFPAGTPTGLFRVALVSGGTPIEAPVQSDGTFEFLKVSPGRYTVRLTQGVSGVTAVQVQVDDKDLLNIEMAVPAFILGRVVVDNGSKLPVQITAIAAGTPDPPALVQIRATRVDSTAPAAAAQPPFSVANNSTATLAAARAGGTDFPTVRADGYFIFNAPAGDYQIVATLLPLGYSIKSAALDLPTGTRLDVTLTTAPLAGDPPGVKISGRVTGLAAAGTATKFVSISVTGATATSLPSTPLRYVGQIPILEDGSFELLRVPPGPATLQVYSGTTSSMSIRLDVDDRDMTIELAVANQISPQAGATATLPLATPAAPIVITIPGPALLATSQVTAAPVPSSEAAIQQYAGVRISGVITGVAPIADEAFPSRTIALTQGSLQRFQALIYSDNTFEFSHVPPGSYNVRLSLGLTYLLSKPIVVEDKDLIGLEIAAPGR